LLDRGYGRATEHVTISAGDQTESAVARMADAALEALLAGMRTVEGEVVRPGTRDLEDGETRSLAASYDPQKSDATLRNLMVPAGVETPSGSSEHDLTRPVATDHIEDAALSPIPPSDLGLQDPDPTFRVTPCQSDGIGPLGGEGPTGRQNPIPTLPAALDQDRDGQRGDGGVGGGAGRADDGGAGRSGDGVKGAGGVPTPAQPSQAGRGPQNKI